MGLNHHRRMLIGISMACFGSMVAHASEHQAPPVLDGNAAMGIALKMAGEATHSQNYSVQGIRFEPSTREWVIQFVAQPDSKPAKSFLARLNESTGLACLELPPSAGCVIQQNIHQAVVEGQAKSDAVAMAWRHPAPDLQNMADVLLRHQIDVDRSHGGESRARYFVSIPAADAKGLVDLSPEIVANLKRDGIDTYPGSAWKRGTETVSLDMHFSIGLPIRRSDGNFDVPYGYYCGPLCAGWYSAVMKHDAAGWHVVSTVMNTIS